MSSINPVGIFTSIEALEIFYHIIIHANKQMYDYITQKELWNKIKA